MVHWCAVGADSATGRTTLTRDVPPFTWPTDRNPMTTMYDCYFEEWLGVLEGYVVRTGHALVPKDCVVDRYRLGQWVIRQRGLHAKGALDAVRVARLQRLPGWSWDPRTDVWEAAFG